MKTGKIATFKKLLQEGKPFEEAMKVSGVALATAKMQVYYLKRKTQKSIKEVDKVITAVKKVKKVAQTPDIEVVEE